MTGVFTGVLQNHGWKWNWIEEWHKRISTYLPYCRFQLSTRRNHRVLPTRQVYFFMSRYIKCNGIPTFIATYLIIRKRILQERVTPGGHVRSSESNKAQKRVRSYCATVFALLFDQSRLKWIMIAEDYSFIILKDAKIIWQHMQMAQYPVKSESLPDNDRIYQMRSLISKRIIPQLQECIQQFRAYSTV